MLNLPVCLFQNRIYPMFSAYSLERTFIRFSSRSAPSKYAITPIPALLIKSATE